MAALASLNTHLEALQHFTAVLQGTQYQFKGKGKEHTVMPLQTQIIRDGKTLGLHWGDFHIAAMIIATAIDSGQGPWDDNSRAGILRDRVGDDEPIRIVPKDCMSLVTYPVLAKTPMGHDPYTLKNGPYTFVDPTDGEVFVLQAGDQLIAYRTM